MPEYVRPTLPHRVFHDAAGDAIAYGHRWPSRIAPEDAYSVVSHPERFAPLHLVADALIEHLAATYEVSVSADTAHAAELMHDGFAAVRAVRMTPRDANAAPLTFVYTSFPGVVVHAGLLHDFPFPDCGCDACDDSIDGLADEMEQLVFAVVHGGYSESVDPRDVGYMLVSAAGHRSGGTARGDLPRERVEDAAQRLRQLSGPWEPWAALESHPH